MKFAITKPVTWREIELYVHTKPASKLACNNQKLKYIISPEGRVKIYKKKN